MVLQAERLECIRDGQLLFSEISFTLQAGEILHVTGANGSGKSSLLEIIVGILMPEQGRVCWQQQAIHAGNTDFLTQLQYIGHKTGVKSHLTVLENLRLAAHLYDAPGPWQWSDILSYFSLNDLQQVLCTKLSAGQRQRVALTRLLLSTALVWVLDEPFTAIDHAGCRILQQLLLEHTARGGLIVLTSHQSLQLEGKVVKRLELD